MSDRQRACDLTPFFANIPQGIVTFSALVTCSRLSRSPWLWRICGYLILAFFLIINVILLATAKEIRSAKYVFTSYHNTTGFKSKSYVYMIGASLPPSRLHRVLSLKC